MSKITKYGTDVVIKMLFITLIIDAIAYLINIEVLKISLFVLSIVLFFFTLYFFRDPEREIPENITADTILSPADGKVVLIETIKNSEDILFDKDEMLHKVCIFLSPLNVHVNRIPVSGTISYYNYIKGKYLVAFNHKSSDKNERTVIGITNVNGKIIIFKQIAGFVARRIVCNLKPGYEVTVGKRFGMIKFGSRVDLLFSSNAKLLTKVGDKVTGGKTIIAEL
ncbi:MAG: phosphatidylserine decarboxylase family protein [Ignavibacteriae bacterium]|nr:phosphatidylserine decarboxylase family protein [Ignavibacteriota bacterium]